jgi:hypothetical protein
VKVPDGVTTLPPLMIRSSFMELPSFFPASAGFSSDVRQHTTGSDMVQTPGEGGSASGGRTRCA